MNEQKQSMFMVPRRNSDPVQDVYDKLGAVRFWWARRLQRDRERGGHPNTRGRARSHHVPRESAFLHAFYRDPALWLRVRKQTGTARYARIRTTLIHLWLAHLLADRLQPANLTDRDAAIPGGLTDRSLRELVKRHSKPSQPYVFALQPAPVGGDDPGPRAQAAFTLLGPPPADVVRRHIDARFDRHDGEDAAAALDMGIMEYMRSYRPDQTPVAISHLLMFRATVLKCVRLVSERLGVSPESANAVYDVLAEPFWPIKSLHGHIETDVALTWWIARGRPAPPAPQGHVSTLPDWHALDAALRSASRRRDGYGVGADARAVLLSNLGVAAAHQAQGAAAKRSAFNAFRAAWDQPRLRPATRAIVACNLALAHQWYGRTDTATSWMDRAIERAKAAEVEFLREAIDARRAKTGRSKRVGHPPALLTSDGIPALAKEHGQVAWLLR